MASCIHTKTTTIKQPNSAKFRFNNWTKSYVHQWGVIVVINFIKFISPGFYNVAYKITFIFNKIPKLKEQGWLTFVDVHMSMHLISSRESAPAFLTFVRFLSSVQAHVHFESTWRGEGKRADFAHVWPFSSVHAYVCLQATEACKILGAQSALVLLPILDKKIFHLFTC